MTQIAPSYPVSPRTIDADTACSRKSASSCCLISATLAAVCPHSACRWLEGKDVPFLQTGHTRIDERMITRYTLLEPLLFGRHLIMRPDHRRQALAEHLAKMVLGSDIASDTDEEIRVGIVPGDLAGPLQFHAEFDGSRFDFVEG